MDFVRIEPETKGKKVVLIFDDLERSNIPVDDLLGCINEYCENSHINTIVVANEEKINNNKENSKYSELKEKIVQRTIYYSPDYSTIVSNIIESTIYETDKIAKDYKAFLKENREGISELFSGPVIESNQQISQKRFEISTQGHENGKNGESSTYRPHNIRSLKCALQDFKRIYILPTDHQVDNKKKWLFTYISYVLCFRSGWIPQNTDIVFDSKISELYFGFYDNRYITNGIKQWVKSGEWNQTIIDKEFVYIIDRDKAVEPVDKVRMGCLLDLDEDDLQSGFPLLLDNAYSGELELDDYVNLICNSILGRRYSIPIPDIDWGKIRIGIDKKIAKMVEFPENQLHHRLIIGNENKKYLLPEEQSTYMVISEFWNSDTLTFEKNKWLYINLISKKGFEGLLQVESKKFNKFDKDMAKATAEGFKRTLNAEKSSFINQFKRMWVSNMCTIEYVHTRLCVRYI